MAQEKRKVEDIRSEYLPLMERRRIFDNWYGAHEIDGVTIDNVRLTSYEFDFFSSIQNSSNFLLDAASVGDEIYTIVPCQRSFVVVLKRVLLD